MSGSGARWTKKDLGVLRSQIDSFALAHRMYRLPQDIRRVIGEHRHTITRSSLEGWRLTLVERRDRDRATSAHWATGVCGRSPGIVERFRRLAVEGDRDIDKLDQILARIAEELPLEVRGYYPSWLPISAPKPHAP